MRAGGVAKPRRSWAMPTFGALPAHKITSSILGNLLLRDPLGAEKVIAAEKGNQKIAVEIKSFIKPSPVQDMHEAVGKHEMYSLALDLREPDRELYLAIPKRAYDNFFQRPFIKEIVKRKGIKLLVYRIDKTEISEWIK
ncbi:MAG: hypothetical protein H6559_05215 [Lewinellaceae bacterium]|nr:hypothetical protein [Lewinellaceae bacterium]